MMHLNGIGTSQSRTATAQENSRTRASGASEASASTPSSPLACNSFGDLALLIREEAERTRTEQREFLRLAFSLFQEHQRTRTETLQLAHDAITEVAGTLHKAIKQSSCETAVFSSMVDAFTSASATSSPNTGPGLQQPTETTTVEAATTAITTTTATAGAIVEAVSAESASASASTSATAAKLQFRSNDQSHLASIPLQHTPAHHLSTTTTTDWTKARTSSLQFESIGGARKRARIAASDTVSAIASSSPRTTHVGHKNTGHPLRTRPSSSTPSVLSSLPVSEYQTPSQTASNTITTSTVASRLRENPVVRTATAQETIILDEEEDEEDEEEYKNNNNSNNNNDYDNGDHDSHYVSVRQLHKQQQSSYDEQPQLPYELVPDEYELSRNIETVKELWREWTVGLLPTRPSVQQMDQKYNTKWRSTAKERKFYSNRLIVIREVQRQKIETGRSLEEVIDALDMEVRSTSWSKLVRRLRKDQAARLESVGQGGSGGSRPQSDLDTDAVEDVHLYHH